MYPINSSLVQTHLHPGPAYHVRSRNLPLLSGRILTPFSVIESILKLEKKRDQKKAEEIRSKKTTEYRQHSVPISWLSLWRQVRASFWMPRFSKVIDSISTVQIALASSSTRAPTDLLIEPGFILKTALRDEPDIVILPAFDTVD